MKKDRRGARLRIHRETIRRLSDDRLARVAGGTLSVDFVLRPTHLAFENGLEAPLPRTNGWTGETGTQAPTC